MESIYRTKLGEYIKTCMVCSAELDKETGEFEYGLCKKHREHILRAATPIRRNFGRGEEFQLLTHSDELDDIIYKMLYDDEPRTYPILRQGGERQFCIYVHYIAKYFIWLLDQVGIDFNRFDYITYPDSGLEQMSLIFWEMGFLCKRKHSKIFWDDELREIMLQMDQGDVLLGKHVLILDLYRGIETRNYIDTIKLLGANKVVTVYLTSYS